MKTAVAASRYVHAVGIIAKKRKEKPMPLGVV